MDMDMNPVLKKELTLGSRTIKMPVALMFYNGFLAFVAVLILFSACSYYYYGGGSMEYGVLTAIFPTLAGIQMGLICLIIPIITASSVAGERERQTLDLLLTTPRSPLSIILGKVWAALINVFMFIISSLPSMAIAFLFGGLKWSYLFIFLISILVVSFFVGAVGIWCSSVFKKTVTSVIITLLIEVIFFLGTLIALGSIIVILELIYMIFDISYGGLGIFPMIIMLNPLSGFVDFLVYAMTGMGLMEEIFSNVGDVSIIVTAIAPYWTIINMVVTILLGVFFVRQAANAIDPVQSKANLGSRKERARQKKLEKLERQKRRLEGR